MNQDAKDWWASSCVPVLCTALLALSTGCAATAPGRHEEGAQSEGSNNFRTRRPSVPQ